MLKKDNIIKILLILFMLAYLLPYASGCNNRVVYGFNILTFPFEDTIYKMSVLIVCAVSIMVAFVLALIYLILLFLKKDTRAFSPLIFLLYLSSLILGIREIALLYGFYIAFILSLALVLTDKGGWMITVLRRNPPDGTK